MKHLQDEDIARMIEGNINKKERRDFLKHLSECDTCLSVYSETFEFIEKEKKDKETARGFGWTAGSIFTVKRLIPAAAALIVIVSLGTFALKEIHHREIKNKQIGYIKNLTEMGSYPFSPSKNEIYAAVRAGFLVEDLSLLVNTGEEELRTKIGKMLGSELKAISNNETGSLSQDLENIERRIRGSLEKRPLAKPFQLGCFLEHSILSTFENEAPKQEDIEKYRRIAQEYKDKLPRGVLKGLKKLKTTGRAIEKIRSICIEIKEIFLE
jgi:hypothetical protein